MLLIKLDATDSTNDYLRELLTSEDPPDGTVVSTGHQRKGRGQMGRNWISEKGKNLTFSILNKFQRFAVGEQFLINIITSLAVVEVLERHDVHDLKIKWPNDILSGRQKICGILVEVIVKGAHLKTAIIGIGLNVNQERFDPGLTATSMKLQTGKTFDLEALLEEVYAAVEAGRKEYVSASRAKLWPSYEQLLFGKGAQLTFRTPEGEDFRAVIEGVDPSGRLKLRHESGILKAYQFNEIKMQY